MTIQSELPLKLVMICQEIPYPPIHGGRVDMWNRIVALANEGVQIFLITWSDAQVDHVQLVRLRSVTAESIIYRRKYAPYLALDPRYPTMVTTRKITSQQFIELEKKIREFAPNLIVLEGFQGWLLAKSLVEKIGVSIIYRSQNVEHIYHRELMKAEKNMFKKLFAWSKLSRIFRTEKTIRKLSRLTYDISTQDKLYWDRIQMSSAKVLHPYLEPEFIISDDSESNCEIDVLYLGNLHSENNLFGLHWFLHNVVPLINKNGNLNIIIAGSNPTLEFISKAKNCKVKILANPKNARLLHGKAKVLINPIFHGSGVNIKMIEMLASGKPVVSTSQGVHGLSTKVIEFVSIADTPSDFADAIHRKLQQNLSISQSLAVKIVYDPSNVINLISELREIASKNN